MTSSRKSEFEISTAQHDIARGERFAFGDNWAAFLDHLDEDRIAIAEKSLQELLGVESLAGKAFVDVGSGSGLFSLCARRLGARVHSFDFDQQSVACTRELKARYFPNDPHWTVESGSVLDMNYLKQVPTFEIVYSWGVLHHTGAMWQALENVIALTQPDGQLSIAIYNDQGWISRAWRQIKRAYCSGPLGKSIVLAMFIPYFALRTVAVSIVRRRNEFASYRRHRGMSIVYDWYDWLGGYPFEVATVEEIQSFYESRGFELQKVKATKRLGCHEFVFVRRS